MRQKVRQNYFLLKLHTAQIGAQWC